MVESNPGGRVKTVFVPFHGQDQFSAQAVHHYEKAIHDSISAGTRIRAILLCNPHNPLGQCYGQDALIAYMSLCKRYALHLIVDEIYALSTYSVSPSEANAPVGFQSVLSFSTDAHIDPAYLHVLYGFSKDLASGGLRIGCIHTKNRNLIAALNPQSFFNWPSNLASTVALAMLEDEAWMDSFLATSKRQLGERSAFAREVLDGYGIPYGREATAGFFLWLDVRQFLVKTPGDKATWEHERGLAEQLKMNGVYLTSGEGMSAENPGFFRLCFVKPEAEVREGLKRLMDTLALWSEIPKARLGKEN